MTRLSFNLGDLLTPEHIAETLDGTGLALGFASARGETFAQVWAGLTPRQRAAAYVGISYAAVALRGHDAVEISAKVSEMSEILWREQFAQAQEDLAAAREAIARASVVLSGFTGSEEVPE
ncbi:MAG: hypothetical protein IE919_19185 [Thioclava sp.]|nr:hypothetical protein [Thioclava sp.]MBD3805337.1 hypothetical protein [Thioclava sp.]